MFKVEMYNDCKCLIGEWYKEASDFYEAIDMVTDEVICYQGDTFKVYDINDVKDYIVEVV